MTLRDRLDSMSWEGLANLGRYVGQVPVGRVTFDRTRRRAIDDNIFSRSTQTWLGLRSLSLRLGAPRLRFDSPKWERDMLEDHDHDRLDVWVDRRFVIAAG